MSERVEGGRGGYSGACLHASSSTVLRHTGETETLLVTTVTQVSPPFLEATPTDTQRDTQTHARIQTHRHTHTHKYQSHTSFTQTQTQTQTQAQAKHTQAHQFECNIVLAPRAAVRHDSGPHVRRRDREHREDHPVLINFLYKKKILLLRRRDREP